MQINNKLREALESIANNLENRLFSRYSHSATDEWMWQKARTALAEPLRNCDVGSVEEQDERFDTYCESHINCAHCPLKGTQCSLVWSQMLYGEVAK